MEQDKKKLTLLTLTFTNKIHYLSLLFVAIAIHLLFIYCVINLGFISLNLFFLLFNAVILTGMYFLVKYLFRDTEPVEILKKLTLYEFLPTIILFLIGSIIQAYLRPGQ